MEETPVTIVGAGPSGLVLALSLARYKIHSIILEKCNEIGEDPRGVYLAGDAVRVLYQLGIGHYMGDIGHPMKAVNFHKTTFLNPEFLKIDLSHDWLEQTVPGGILQIQPELEKALREEVKISHYSELRCGCNVVSCEELQGGGLIVEYENPRGENSSVKTSWLVGADGKKGVVRKNFLEPVANTRQEVGLYAYEGTWIASNLKITPPSPKTHPDLCFWEMGMHPDDVYDLFWPEEWRFCRPPGKPTAAGRFGPHAERFWRHEFAEPDWDETKNAEELLWQHITPMITRRHDSRGRAFPCGPIVFPRECIEIRRCRPFTFCQRVVNKWFHHRTILIGDAAHVFPPFGGQGIASGIRDGDGLAWRLAILLRQKSNKELNDRILQEWAHERRQGVDDSTKLTMSNGILCNNLETWGDYCTRMILTLLSYIPGFPSISKYSAAFEKAGYRAGKGGFFLKERDGGGKIAQIYVKTATGVPILSDLLLQHGKSILTLLVFGTDASDVVEARTAMERSSIDGSILSEESIVRFSPVDAVGHEDMNLEDVYRPCSEDDLAGFDIMPGYNPQAYCLRFPRGTKFAIVRPDLIIYSTARTIKDMQSCLDLLKVQLQN